MTIRLTMVIPKNTHIAAVSDNTRFSPKSRLMNAISSKMPDTTNHMMMRNTFSACSAKSRFKTQQKQINTLIQQRFRMFDILSDAHIPISLIAPKRTIRRVWGRLKCTDPHKETPPEQDFGKSCPDGIHVLPISGGSAIRRLPSLPVRQSPSRNKVCRVRLHRLGVRRV